MADTTARIRLALEGAGEVERDLGKVGAKVSSLAKNIAGLVGVGSVASFAGKLLSVQREFDVLNSSLVTVTGSSANASREFAWIKSFAATTPYQLNEVTSAFVKMKALGLDASQKALTSYGNTASAMGKDLNQMIEAVADAATGEFERLKEFGIKSSKQGDQVSFTFQGVTKTIGNSSAEITTYLRNIGDVDFAGAMARRADTLDGAISNLADGWDDLFRTINDKAAGSLIADTVALASGAVGDLTLMIGALTSTTSENARETGALIAVQGGLATVFETVLVGAADVKYVLQQVGDTLGGLAAGYAAFFSGNFEGTREIGRQMKANGEAARAEIDAFQRSVLSARKINESLKGASGLDEPKFRRMLGAGGAAAKEAAPHVEKLTGSVGRQRAAVKGLTEAEKELAEIRKQDLAVGVLRNKQAEENYKAALQAADVEAQFRQIVIDKEMDWQQEADDEKLKASREILDRQQKETEEFWASVDSTAHDVFVSVATEGEDAFKRIGKTLKAAILDMLYQMTIKKWIFQISGVSTGGGSTGSLLDYASSAYSAYQMGSAGGAGTAGASGSMAAVGSYASGSMSGANAAGSIYANYTGAGIDGLLATNSAYGTAAGGSAAGSAGTSAMGYMGYAALIAAAVLIAENLYAKGYNRAALGKGPGGSNTVGNTTFTADSRMGNSNIYNGSPENFNRMLGDAIGLNEKWVDMLSGTTRMATLFGRKLSAYGFQADIAGGDADVSGFQRYKGKLRGNKTVAADIDPRDAANFDAIVESTIEGSKAMARAMGYSDEAINAYTGSLKVNFKGAKTAEEQAERVATAMDDLNFELLKTASGGKLAREDFKAMMEGIQKDIQGAGISGEGIADILVQGMTGRLSGADVGDQLASMIVGGIYNAIASSYASQIAALFMNQIITPIFTAIAAGVPISQAVSAASIKATVATAREYMAVVGAIFNDPEFRAFMDEFKAQLGVTGAAAASVAPPSIRTYSGPSAGQTAADEAKREKAQLEMEILRLQGNTVEIRRRELLEIKPGNRLLQQRVWALEDEKEILDERRDLERELLELQGDTNALRALERDALHESNRALFDQIKALEDVEKLKDTWSSVIDAMADEMKRLREEILGASPEGRAYAAAEFAMATAQARAGDSAAAERLPDLARMLVDIASETAGSLSDLRAVQGSTLASLAETQQILGATYGIELPKFAVGTNYVPRDMVAMIHEGEAIVPKAFNPAAGGGSQAELVTEIRNLRADLQALKGLGVGQLAAAGRVEQLLDSVTNGGSHMRTKEVTA